MIFFLFFPLRSGIDRKIVRSVWIFTDAAFQRSHFIMYRPLKNINQKKQTIFFSSSRLFFVRKGENFELFFVQKVNVSLINSACCFKFLINCMIFSVRKASLWLRIFEFKENVEYVNIDCGIITSFSLNFRENFWNFLLLFLNCGFAIKNIHRVVSQLKIFH